MQSFFEKISILCFAASYGVAFALELWHLFRPRPILRILALVFGGAGLFAHVVFLIVQCLIAEKRLPLGSPTGSLLFLALILAVFYFSEAIHHARIAWALFVLPLVLGLIGLAVVLPAPSEAETWRSFWSVAHGILLLLAAVGVSIGFIASVMYLVQMRRLRHKLPPNQGVPLLSLERLEQMNRRAILLAFPLLTAGLLAGVVLEIYNGIEDWLSLRILSVVCLWLVFAILLYLRYFVHVRGRQLALWTMFAFAILVVALVSPHSFMQGGGP
ncbi:MAG TPA: cytochrome c biogenesis protein CcsA [Gemmataceae bacterium]|nr:cytochrome c biogenesis protein CcsA [Gemmataceae bacterium]